jgi:hypothetical protein
VLSFPVVFFRATLPGILSRTIVLDFCRDRFLSARRIRFSHFREVLLILFIIPAIPRTNVPDPDTRRKARNSDSRVFSLEACYSPRRLVRVGSGPIPRRCPLCPDSRSPRLLPRPLPPHHVRRCLRPLLR